MVENRILRKCPFCGSEAEINCDKTRRRDGLASTEMEAEQWIEKRKSIGVVLKSEIYEVNKKWKYRKHFAVYTIEMVFVPRCTKTSCIARRSVSFNTEEEACNAWNSVKTE